MNPNLQTSPTPTLTPQQMAQNYAQMKGTSSDASPKTSWDAYDSAVGNSNKPAPTGAAATVGSEAPGAGSIIKNLEDTFSQGGQNVANDVRNEPKLAEDAGNSGLAKTLAVGATAGHVAGDVAGTAGGIIGSFMQPFIPDSVKSKIGDVSKFVSDKVNSIPGMTPEIAKSLGDVFNTVTLDLGEKAAPAAQQGIEQIGKTAGAVTGEALSKTQDVVSSGIGKATDIVSKAKNAIAPSLTPEESVGQIIQGKTEDIAAAKRTLSSIDTDGVKTYKDLQKKIDSEINPLAKRVDDELAKDTSGGKSIKSFGQTVGEGKAGVKVNYVRQGIDDLRNFYQKTNDAAGLSKMAALENKARISGLTYKDVNDLARLHGQEINAFNANGEAASGITKQAAENTRSGLKGIARQGIGGKAAKMLDAKLSDLYDTKALVDKQVEKVNAAIQKTTKIGRIPKMIQKGVRVGVKTVDTLTGNPIKAIGKELGLGGATDTLSPLDIESKLAKNLKSIRGK